jgi:hypothetical protein
MKILIQTTDESIILFSLSSELSANLENFQHNPSSVEKPLSISFEIGFDMGSKSDDSSENQMFKSMTMLSSLLTKSIDGQKLFSPICIPRRFDGFDNFSAIKGFVDNFKTSSGENIHVEDLASTDCNEIGYVITIS